MEKETLKEVAERIYDDNLFNYEKYRDGFIRGAKWQSERMYSEEEVKRLAFDFYYDMSHKMGVNTNQISENATNVDIWFYQQIKKK